MIKDADEIALLRAAAHAADRVVAAIAAGPLVGRTEADVAREVRGAAGRRGARGRDVRDRRLRAELGVAASRGVRAGHPARRADRARYRRDARRLWLGHHPDAVGDRRRRRRMPGRAVPPPVRRPLHGPGAGDDGRSSPGSRARRSMPRRAA